MAAAIRLLTLLCALSLPAMAGEAGKDFFGDPLPEGAAARLGTLRMRHMETVNTVAYSRDGKYLVTVPYSGDIVVWDLKTGLAVCTPQNWFKTVPNGRLIGFASDGKRMAIASMAGVAGVWELPSGKLLHKLDPVKPHSGFLSVIVFSPDDKQLATGTWDGRVIIWDSATGKVAKELPAWAEPTAAATTQPASGPASQPSAEPHVRRLPQPAPAGQGGPAPAQQKMVMGVSFSPDGKRLAACGIDGRVRVWNTADWSLDKTLDRHGVRLSNVTFFADSQRLVWSESGVSLIIHDLATGREQSFDTGISTHFALAPDNKTLVAILRDGAVVGWDLESGQMLYGQKEADEALKAAKEIVGGNSLIGMMWYYHVAISPDSNEMATSSGGFARVGAQVPFFRHVRSGEPFERLAAEGYRITSVKFLDDRTIRTTSFGGAVRTYDAATGRMLTAEPNLTQKPMAFSGDRTLAAWADMNRLGVKTYPKGDVVLKEYTQPCAYFGGGVISEDNRLLATVGVHRNPMQHQRSVYVLDIKTGKDVAVWSPLEGTPMPLQFARQGRWLLVGGSMGNDLRGVYLLDIPTQQVLRHLPMRKGCEIHAMAVSRDERLVAISASSMVSVYELASGQLVGTFVGQSNTTPGLAFSRDGRRLAACDWDKQVHVWDICTQRQLAKFKHTMPVDVVAFSPDGTRVASGGWDTTVLVWSLEKFAGQPAATKPAGKTALDEAMTTWLLSSADKAYAVLPSLLAVGDDVVPLCESNLKVAPPNNYADQLKAIVADLGSESSRTRQAAAEKLAKLPAEAAPVVDQELAKATALDVKAALQDWLTKTAKREAERPEQQVMLRSIAMLEYLGSPNAIKLLKKLAAGEPLARVTQESQQALDRLTGPTSRPAK